jgi:putative SOS response-associated peptidase YedK
MCGRIAQSEPSRFAQRLGALVDPEVDGQPRWNLAPTDPILGVRELDGTRTLAPYRWGLLPGSSKDPRRAARTFNARAEAVATKPMYRGAFRQRRLLVPVDGFYEWAPVAGSRRKQPHFFHRADGEPAVLAGLWALWAVGDDRRRTATVITSVAGPDMPVHDRQPVVLEPEAWDRWLDPELHDLAELEAMLRPAGGVLVHHPVRPDVGSVRNDGAYLVEPIAAPLPGPSPAPPASAGAAGAGSAGDRAAGT